MFKLFKQFEIILTIDSDGASPSISHPYGILLVVNRYPIDGHDLPLTCRVRSGRDMLCYFELFWIDLAKLRLFNGWASYGRCHKEHIVLAL